tara:strand:- start:352 stop:513 length:162 start_codon:yes stop_codon:yes gene_type:complete
MSKLWDMQEKKGGFVFSLASQRKFLGREFECRVGSETKEWDEGCGVDAEVAWL